MPLTDQEKEQIFGLRMWVDGTRRTTLKEFLSDFRGGQWQSNPVALVAELLGEAAATKNADEVECAMLLGFNVGFVEANISVLSTLAQEDWHFRHEDVVSAIQDLKCKGAVRVLEHRALNTPEYLEWDENYALARKCTWALADIGTTEARQALERLSNAENPAIRKFAQRRLDQWHLELERKGG